MMSRATERGRSVGADQSAALNAGPALQEGTVCWTRFGFGTHATRCGRVVEVVPPGEQPSLTWLACLSVDPGESLPRDHESYVVMVGETTFWPDVTRVSSGKEPAR